MNHIYQHLVSRPLALVIFDRATGSFFLQQPIKRRWRLSTTKIVDDRENAVAKTRAIDEAGENSEDARRQ